MKNVAETLEEAADLIQVYGHQKGQVGDREIGYCVTGAICSVGGHDGLASDFFAKWVVANGLTSGAGFLSGVKFNNAPETTSDDVIDAMKHAAKDWRAEHESE